MEGHCESQFKDHKENKIIQPNVKSSSGAFVRPWEMERQLRPGTLVAAIVQFHRYTVTPGVHVSFELSDKEDGDLHDYKVWQAMFQSVQVIQDVPQDATF